MSYARDKSAETFGVLTRNTTSYRSSGAVASLDFDATQRQAVGDTQGGGGTGLPSGGAVPRVPVPTPAPQTTLPHPPRTRPAIVEDFSLVPAGEEEVKK